MGSFPFIYDLTIASFICSVLLLLLLLSHFSHVWLCATPETAAHQAPPSLGFSRKEHWSGLPFPSPMHARKISCFSHAWLCAILWTAAHQASLSTGFSRQEYWSVAISFSIWMSKIRETVKDIVEVWCCHVVGYHAAVKNKDRSQSNLQIQCNPYQNSNGIFHRNIRNTSKICMEPQKTPKSQSNLEKEHSWRHHAPWFQVI